MSPILTDGLHPVGGVWPAGDKLFFDGEGKERFCGGPNESSAPGNYFARTYFAPSYFASGYFASGDLSAARRRLRQASRHPAARHASTPRLTRLFTMA
jgi:hypothetical protein